MSVDKAKEFLVDATEDADIAARVHDSYLSALVAVSKGLGYDLTTNDVALAIEEMSGLVEPEFDVEGFGRSLLDSVVGFGGPASLGVIANPLGFGRFGRFR